MIKNNEMQPPKMMNMIRGVGTPPPSEVEEEE
jgi:hypothetical protein